MTNRLITIPIVILAGISYAAYLIGMTIGGVIGFVIKRGRQ